MLDVEHVYVSPAADAHLRLYGPRTYAIDLPPDVARELVAEKLVEPVPVPAWQGTGYGLTSRGAKYLDKVAP